MLSYNMHHGLDFTSVDLLITPPLTLLSEVNDWLKYSLTPSRTRHQLLPVPPRYYTYYSDYRLITLKRYSLIGSERWCMVNRTRL
jgi:hypothetical protein